MNIPCFSLASQEEMRRREPQVLPVPSQSPVSRKYPREHVSLNQQPFVTCHQHRCHHVTNRCTHALLTTLTTPVAASDQLEGPYC